VCKGLSKGGDEHPFPASFRFDGPLFSGQFKDDESGKYGKYRVMGHYLVLAFIPVLCFEHNGKFILAFIPVW
jgi:hypothetical protein